MLEDGLEGHLLQVGGTLVDKFEDPVKVRFQLVEHGPPWQLDEVSRYMINLRFNFSFLNRKGTPATSGIR
jgi:hypothetical protein